MDRQTFDTLVKRKRKCLHGACTDNQPPSMPLPPPIVSDPKVSAFANPQSYLPSSLFERAVYVSKYTQQMNDLAAEMFNVQQELINYQQEIDAGSHRGVGQYIQEGNQLLQQLSYHQDRARHKQVMHNHLNLNDLQMLYNHAVYFQNQTGTPHPPNHPKDASATNSKTALVEALTHTEDGYGLEPMAVLQYYHTLQPQPSTT